jgi:beta-glucosidase
MKYLFKLIFFGLIFIPVSCEKHKAPVYKDKSESIEKRVDDLLSRMTVEEKVAQTLGIWSAVGMEGEFSTDSVKKYFPHGLGSLHRRYLDQSYEEAANESNEIQKYFIENTRLEIPVLINSEGLHGLMAKNATIFPSAIGLASSWDTVLFHQIYTVVAEESRALGIQQLFSPNLDIVRDPRWGRTSENFGEDPYLTAQLGIACINSLQGNGNIIDDQHVAATAKHFAVHGQPEGGINQAPANISVREIYSMFLPPFKAAITEANVRFIMASYNEIDGIPTHKNQWLLKNVLRDELGFTGVVISDYYGIEQLYSKHLVAKDRDEAARLALGVGVDIDLGEPPYYSYPTLVEQIKKKEISESLLDESVKRILRLKFELGLFDDPYIDSSKANAVVNNEAHQKLALEAAYESIVLLKNENKPLPLNKEKLKSIAVVGPNANTVQLVNFAGTNEKSTTVLEGIEKALGKDKVKFAQGCILPKETPDGKVTPYNPEKNRKLIQEAVRIAKNCDAIVLAIGDNIDLCQELDGNRSGDIATLDLVGEQNELAKAMYETGKPVIVLLLNGRPIAFNYIKDNLPAIIECWHPGEATGTAIADIVFGKINPSGKLPITFPASVGHIPSYYNRKLSSPIKYVVNDNKYLYPFGYGLSYTKFEYKNPTLSPSTIQSGEVATVSIEVKNTGEVEGAEIVQLYIRDCLSSVTRPIKELKGFERINLNPGESKIVKFSITPAQLEFYNEKMKKVIEPGTFEIKVGSSSEELTTILLNVI